MTSCSETPVPDRTEVKQKPSFFNSLLCLCQWGSSNNNGKDNSEIVRKSKSFDDIVRAHQRENGAIRTRVSRIQLNEMEDESHLSYSTDASSVFTDASSAFSRTKRRRRKKNKNISNSSAINNSDGDDLKKVTLEEINEDMDNITVCTENMSIISADEEFLMIMRGGLGLQAVTNFGTTRMVTVCIDNDRLSWGVSRSKPAMFVPVDQIALVQVGMPLKLASSFSQSDRDRSFNIVLSKDNKTATFLAPTPLERDALVHGFAMIVTTRNSNHIERCDSHTQQL